MTAARDASPTGRPGPAAVLEDGRPAALAPAQQVTALFHEHADFVWRSLLRLGVGVGAAEDALQDVFLVVHRRIHAYDERGSTRAWLFAISKRVAAHYRRGVARTTRRTKALEAVAGGRSTGPDPDASVARKEAVAFVESFMAQLDEPRRLVFLLADVEGLTAPEIATALGVKLNTVYSRLRHARTRLARKIAQRREEQEQR